MHKPHGTVPLCSGYGNSVPSGGNSHSRHEPIELVEHSVASPCALAHLSESMVWTTDHLVCGRYRDDPWSEVILVEVTGPISHIL